MLTRDQLSERLMAFDVKQLAEAAQVSTKTIYRLRNKTIAPNFATVEALLAGMERLSKPKARRAA